MRINVKLFAILKDRAGVADVALDLPTATTVTAAAEAIAKQYPQLSAFLPRIAFAVNQTYTDRATVLKEGDELALIPPVSGGRP